MRNKRYLAPVLALLACGLPAGASVVTYCAGTGCSPDSESQFTTDLGTADDTLQGLTTFVSTNLAGSVYTDATLNITFTDFLGQSMTVTGGGELKTPATYSSPNYIVISLPATVAAFEIMVDVPNGVCLDAACPANQTTGFVGFINTTPGSPWTVEIGPYIGGNYVGIDSYAIGTNGASDADTPEVGTMLLIGAGLVSMRWLKRVPRRWFQATTPHLAS